MAFGSNESGSWEVYVAVFPSWAEKKQVSLRGGVQPLWRKDGQELFYLTPQGEVVAVEIKAGERLQTSPPQMLFKSQLYPSQMLSQYCVSADGQRFLFLDPVNTGSDSFKMVLNWPASSQTTN